MPLGSPDTTSRLRPPRFATWDQRFRPVPTRRLQTLDSATFRSYRGRFSVVHIKHLANRAVDKSMPIRAGSAAGDDFARCFMWTTENRPDTDRKGLRYPTI